MRVALIIFALIGIASFSMVVVIGTGLLHLSSLDALAAGGGVDPAATQQSTDPNDADGPDPPATRPANSPDAIQPAMIDRSVFLSAQDATLTGPRIALMTTGNFVLKTSNGQEQIAPPPPPGPGFQGWGRNGMGRNGRRSRPPPAPFLSRWFSPDDSAEWTFESPAAGEYQVSFVYSGSPGRGDDGEGSIVVSTADEQFIARLKRTTNSRAFEMASVGTLQLPRGPCRLSIHPQDKVTRENDMRLRSVRLYPKDTPG